MASMDFIQKRIDGKRKEIDKLEKKLSRIRKAEATGWENNPYGYSDYDLKYTQRDLEEARKGLEKWERDLTEAQEKANSRNVPAILEFLEMWKANCKEFYGEGLRAYYDEQAKVRELGRRIENFSWRDPERKEAEEAYEKAAKAFRSKEIGYYETFEFINRFGRPDKGSRKVRDGEYEYLRPYTNARTLADAMDKLSKDLDEEANRKYDFIIERTNAIVGEITDASGLSVGSKQDLNGYIVGKRGVAKVQTIGAGGYNVQCFHFRTLIHEGY